MSTISSLASPSASQGATPTQSIDKHIKALEKRIQDAVGNGSLTQSQADDLTKQLDQIQQQVDQGASDGRLSTADLRKISRLLHEIGHTLAQAGSSSGADATSGAPDSDGDDDGSTAANSSVGVDKTV